MYPSTIPDMRTFKGEINMAHAGYDHRQPSDLGSASLTTFVPNKTVDQSNILVPMSANSSPYPNRSSQRNGEKRTWAQDGDIPKLPPEMSDSIGQRYQQHNGQNPRRSNVIRIDARNHSDNHLDQTNGVKRKASCLRTNVSPNSTSQMPNALGPVSPPVDHEQHRYASLLRTNSSNRSAASKGQQPTVTSGQRVHQKHNSTNGSYGGSQITASDTLPRNAMSQDATLPYAHRQRHASIPSEGMQDYKIVSSATSLTQQDQKCPCSNLQTHKSEGSRVTFATDKQKCVDQDQQPPPYQSSEKTNGKQAITLKPCSNDDHTASSSLPKIENKNKNQKKKKKNYLLWIILVLTLLLLTTVSLLIYYASQMKDSGKISVTNSGRSRKPNVTVEPLSTLFSSTLSNRPTVTRVTDLPDRSQDGVCLTDSCLKASARILAGMDRSVDPCQDFYSYACGGWLSENYIDPSRMEYAVATKIAEKNDRILHELLVRPSPQLRGFRTNNTSQAEEKIKMFYYSCLDLHEIETLGSKPLVDLIVSLGGWAAMGEESRWNLNELIYQNHGVLSNSVFFSISVKIDPFNASQHILIVDQQGSLTLPDRIFYFNGYQVGNRMEGHFKQGMRSILGLILPAQNVEAVVDDVYNFEKRLATIQISVEDMRRRSFAKVSIRRLKTLCPQVEWFRLLQRILTKKQLRLDTEVIVVGPQYFFSNLSRLIHNSSKDTLQNYMMWRVVFSQLSRLSLPFRRAAESLTYSVYGIKGVIPRWQECLKYAKQQFSTALGIMFAKETFTPAMKKDVRHLASYIKEAFRRNLKSIQWLDRPSKVALSKQLDRISVKIGYRNKYKESPELLDKLYSFEVQPYTFFENYRRSVKAKIDLSAGKLASDVDYTEWQRPYFEANAYFSEQRKHMIFPAGFLQSPFYIKDAPRVVNFGAVGSTIGHELIHGFDDIVNRFNDDGSVKDWWTTQVLVNYSQQADCVTQTYNRYSNFIGASSEKENIADMAGVKLSYKAYQLWKQSQQKMSSFRDVLPGLSLSNDQVFFVSYAQSWCNKRVGVSQPNLSGAHAPEKYRVIGSLSQFQKFSDVFSCEPGRPMNPVQKCSVW
uniref:endothelin-converting enzyme-like 1 n=1 Tax=Ciona intestinalis TaxID=7719 RepID=UPI000180CDD3|nr:endothelin-converting enzyme-like 1 [Ciona intestinalis]|eukprot:XP_002125740.1 endothelin-converting enzyme-like 1 [Ciona intestinalis]